MAVCTVRCAVNHLYSYCAYYCIMLLGVAALFISVYYATS